MIPFSSNADAEAPSNNRRAKTRRRAKSTIIEPVLDKPSSTQVQHDTASTMIEVAPHMDQASDAMITALTVVSPQGRKLPRCSKCKRPRKGHPRVGCPFVDLPPLKAVGVTCEGGSKHETGSTPIESLDVEAAVSPLQVLTPSMDSGNPTAEASPPPRSLHDDGNDVFIVSTCLQEPLHVEATAAAAASTRPSAENTTTGVVSSHIPLFAGSLSPELFTSSIPPLNEQSEKPPKDPEQHAKLGGAEPCQVVFGSALWSANAGSFTSILSLQPEAGHAVVIIPNLEAAVNNLHNANEGLKAVPIQLILRHEEKTLQGFVFTGMIANGTGGARKIRLQGRLPMLQTAIFAAFVGAIAAWTVMAYA